VPFDEPNVDSATDMEMSHAQLPRTLSLRWKRVHSITSSSSMSQILIAKPDRLPPAITLTEIFSKVFLMI